jgi:UrcA family protein
MSSHTASSACATRIVVAALLAIAAAVPASSYAETPTIEGDTPAVTVKYSDLNLTTTEGSRALYQRLVAAARQVCPQRGYATELVHNREVQRCINSTVERAVHEIKTPSPQFAQIAAEARLR